MSRRTKQNTTRDDTPPKPDAAEVAAWLRLVLRLREETTRVIVSPRRPRKGR